jgi:TIG domain/IPT/TIG domain
VLVHRFRTASPDGRIRSERTRLALQVASLAFPLLLTACGKDDRIAPAEPKGSQAAAVTAPEIRELFPPIATVGVPFQAIEDGSSSLGVAGTGFTRSSQVYFGDRALQTNYQSPKAVAAIVPNDLVATAGSVPVTVRDRKPDRTSASVVFRILPPKAAGEVAVIKDLFPPGARAGIPFGAQPDGRWTLGVAGSGFDPKSTVVFDDVELKTIFQSPVAIVAFVPPELVAKPRRVKVVVMDKESRSGLSASTFFDIQP